MSRARAFALHIAGLLSLAAAAPAHAAPTAPDKNATATVVITQPAELRNLQELNFAILTVAAAGTATVDPNTDAMTTTGGVLHVGGTPYAALFQGVSPVKGVVIIRLPDEPITVTRVGGTETMTVSDWTVSGNKKKTVVAQEPFDFKVGGTLYVNDAQAEGDYVGTFTVELQYP